MEQINITRKATLIGNGAHIFVPKEWAGEEVVLTRKPQRPLEERVLDLLKPHLNSVSGAFLFGSYARGEQTDESDIDLFVVVSKKIKIKEKGFEILCVEENKFENALNISPVMVYSMLAEAKAIINGGLLDKLRDKFKPSLKDFKEFLEECLRIYKINEELLEKSKEREYLVDSASTYSLILRLRGLFIINLLLMKKEYSKSAFKEWVTSGVDIDFDSIYSVYLEQKAERNSKRKIKRSEIILLNEFFKKEAMKLNEQ